MRRRWLICIVCFVLFCFFSSRFLHVCVIPRQSSRIVLLTCLLFSFECLRDDLIYYFFLFLYRFVCLLVNRADLYLGLLGCY
ncbi:hypothetical protein BGW36DRAFT_381309 [Talaromyces proteolyticus]|uniref:Uncharacterized protein n=1 Tax=Talaromyces proteolyticus TaxID=1131652 RepID=A0AAD4PVJ9_9EURO|nr:uncharacterized protein BGW36DRAFT_381309 [Talaromyces proteolyticus]KAH8696605.1 hypothetical protein BGW36DRAFT_381309 [Talaromyces proteolyticus]